jgi:hypothetical protein
MVSPRNVLSLLFVMLAVISIPILAPAEIDDQLSAYTNKNAEGYLSPLADAFGASLNSGLFHSASIPEGLRVSLEFRAVVVFFGDDDRTFRAVTEGNFLPEQTVDAPTVVGPGTSVTVPGSGGTSYIFPGGFDLHRFGLIVPQLRVGSVMGTEALLRYFALETGDDDLGKLSLFGFGMRHSISQYLGPLPPLDIAAGFFWQKFKLGENDTGGDLFSSSAFSIGVQASKNLGIFQPYAGLAMDYFSMDVDYDSEASGVSEPISFDYSSDTSARLTAGFSLNFFFLHLNTEYSIANQNSFSFGVALGNF